MNMANEFNGKVALVTGAAQGIGQAILLELGKRGATVVGIDLTANLAESITNFCRDQGIKGRGFAMDVSQLSSIEAGLEDIKKVFGVPAILVNNAGVVRDNLVMRMSQEEWDKVIFTNLYSVFWLSKACVREMVKARWGRIISISSVVAFRGNAGQANYCASKAAIVAFSKALALEVASRNITVNTIAPGIIESEMTRNLTPEQRERILKDVPMHRAGEPFEVAKAVAFLASDGAAYITGTTIHVNGGLFNI